MNKIKLPLASRSEISFKMNIFGTQTQPSQVSLNLEKGKTVLSFLASLRGEEYVCEIAGLDKTFDNQGEVKCTITVNLNGKVFTPFRGIAEIVDVIQTQPTANPDEEVTVIDFIQPNPPQKDTKVTELPKEIPQFVQPQVKPVLTPKFEEKRVEPAKITALVSLLKNIEKPVEKPVLESKTQKTQLVKPKTKKIFEIKRVSVIYK